MTQKKLEQYSWFPYVAWTLTIVFAGYVMFLAINFKEQAVALQDSTLSLEYRVTQIERMLSPETATPTTAVNEQATNEMIE